ncbi:MAG: helix-turn-helix domain-containing protein [Acidimicrobiales bacterium]
MSAHQESATSEQETAEADDFVEDLVDLDAARRSPAYRAVLGRHLLASLRLDAGLTQQEVADRRGVSQGAVRQAETRDIAKMQVGLLLEQMRAIGHDVDVEWFIEVLAANAPARAAQAN